MDMYQCAAAGAGGGGGAIAAVSSQHRRLRSCINSYVGLLIYSLFLLSHIIDCKASSLWNRE